MNLNSSILIENSSNKTGLDTLKNQSPESYLQSVLELNDELHCLDLECKLQYMQEGMISNAKDVIVNILNKIIDFLKNFISNLFNTDIDCRSRFKTLKKKSKNFTTLNELGHDEYNLSILYYPSPNSIDSSKVKESVSDIVNTIKNIANGTESFKPDDASLMNAYKNIARVCSKSASRNLYKNSVNNSESFMLFIKSNVVYIEKKPMELSSWLNRVRNIVPWEKKDVADKISTIKDQLELCRNNIKNIDKEIDIDEFNNVKILTSQLHDILGTWTWYINYIYKEESKYLSYINNIYDSLMKTINETSTIHGEPFNHDTLFDNEDMRDFNRTEWMDLKLTTECFALKFELDEYKYKTMINESNILSDNDSQKIYRLQNIQEAEMSNVRERINGIIKQIENVINEFIKKINNNINLNKKYIENNKNIIEKPITLEKIISNGDILAGMSRLEKRLIPDPFNYENTNTDILNEKQYFEKRILPKLNVSSSISKRKVAWSNDMSITEYCKLYYGASMTGEKYKPCEFTGAEFEANKDKIIKFVTDSRDIINNIREQLKVLKDNATKFMNTQNKPNSNNKEKKEETESKHETYYSLLYNDYITEAKIDAGEAPKSDEMHSDNTSISDSAAFNIYYRCYKDVLMSELTAAEFITSEFMQAIKAHVNKLSKNSK